MLAITLGDIQSTRLLITKGANVNVKNDEGWTGMKKLYFTLSSIINLIFTAMQEAIATGDPEMVQLVMENRDYQRHSNRATGVSKLLKLLEESPDFYVEMKWEFISWGRFFFYCRLFLYIFNLVIFSTYFSFFYF